MSGFEIEFKTILILIVLFLVLNKNKIKELFSDYNTLKNNNQCLKNVTNENCMRCLYDIGVTNNAGNQFGNSANYCRTTVAVNQMFNAGAIGYDNLRNAIENKDEYSKNSYTNPPCGAFLAPIIPTDDEITTYSNCREQSVKKEEEVVEEEEEVVEEDGRKYCNDGKGYCDQVSNCDKGYTWGTGTCNTSSDEVCCDIVKQYNFGDNCTSQYYEGIGKVMSRNDCKGNSLEYLNERKNQVCCYEKSTKKEAKESLVIAMEKGDGKSAKEKDITSKISGTTNEDRLKDCMEKAQKEKWEGINPNGITMTKDYKKCFAEFEMYDIKKDSSNYITGYIGPKITKPPCLGHSDCDYCCFVESGGNNYYTLTDAEKDTLKTKKRLCTFKYC